MFNGLRYIVRTGGQWQFMPNDLPLWPVVYQQAQRWIRAQCFETMVENLRMLLREFSGRKAQQTPMILDSRTRNLRLSRGRERATMGPSGARDRRSMRPWIRWAIYWPCMSRRPMSRTAHRPANWPGKCMRSQKEMSMSIRATWENRQKRRLPSTASNWKWSSTPRPNAASYCYREDRRRREASPEAPASAAGRDYESPATTLGAFHVLAFACLMIATLFRLLA